MADMTREQMEQIIRSREAVMYDGRVITSIQDLPTEAELAKGDKVREAQARESIKQQLRELASQLSILDTSSEEDDEEDDDSAFVQSFGVSNQNKAEIVSETEEGKARQKELDELRKAEEDAFRSQMKNSGETSETPAPAEVKAAPRTSKTAKESAKGE